jgi:asparagine synthase (glutamine-hydrolysing)
LCGINGILSNDPEIKSSILHLNKLVRHRGPDDEGYVCVDTQTGSWVSFSGEDSIEQIRSTLPDISFADFHNFNLVFGHRRLSIIDLSKRGHCPMSDENGKVWITYNGEIYNYIELRQELESFGFKFRTQSDTEVIIRAYQKWGEEAFTRFNGMWAFGLWDSVNGKLILSRDRFGVKPLYYMICKDYFAFSSEIKPLIYLRDEFTINEAKIPFFLLYGNRLNSEETYIDNIHSLRPSHYLVYNWGNLNIKRYYSAAVRKNDDRSEQQLGEELLNLFIDSVKLRFRSDVPVGTCLSGGFDSSSIAAISHLISPRKLNTFSAVWSQKECDESRYIDIVNTAFGCTANKIEPPAEEFEETFDKISYYQEIPTEGPGLYPQWYVMKKANGVVKVLLDGQGGDEVFGGYFSTGFYLKSLIADGNYGAALSNWKLALKYLSERGIHSFASSLFPHLYNKAVRGFLSDRHRMLNDSILSKLNKEKLYLDTAPPEIFDNYLNNLSYHYVTNLTVPALLHYEDRSSMAHSIESRVPFLDYRLVEFGLNLPARFLSEKNGTRPLYRRVFEKYLPAQITARKDKLGYPTPFAKWTRTSLKSMVSDVLLNGTKLKPFINRQFVEKKLREHFENKIDFSWEIWRLLSFEKFLSLPGKVRRRTEHRFEESNLYP